ncbi:sigma-70 family RNA polymerase sigma factor [Streptosporangium sp. NPDC002524]|uniref:sigma-70 family RNA polymerase sigma factor n=1 Tax=Streptosporangium sp. NPDC002524 TaxID=3154537 RepID=UPI003317D9EF
MTHSPEVSATSAKRLEQTLDLVKQCAADRTVTRDVLDQVAVMAGLTDEELSMLPQTVLSDGILIIEAAVGSSPAEEAREPATAPPAVLDLEAAAAAAWRVMERDRTQLHPERRLLTAEQEVGLWFLLRGGHERLEEEPDDAVFARIPVDDPRRRARDAFVLHNLRLVHSLVPGWCDQGLDYEDLFQHGVLGLMHAVCKFDGRRGLKFSTYATWWIRQSLSRAVADTGAAIRIPVHLHDSMRKVSATESRLRREGRKSSAVDVAMTCGLTVPEVEKIRKLSRVTDSCDRVVRDGVALGELLRGNSVLGPEDVLRHKWSREAIECLLVELPPREADVLRRRIGLVDGDIETLDRIGVSYNVTRERIRQLEVRALKHIRQQHSRLQ